MSFLQQKFSRAAALSIFTVGLITGAVATAVASGALGSSLFSDVERGSFYDSAVGNMSELGIIKGYDDGKFHPNDAVTRAQVAVLLDRLRMYLQSSATISSASSVESIAASSSSSSSSARSVSSSSSKSSSTSSSTSRNPHGSFHFTTPAATVAESAGVVKISIVRIGGAAGTVTLNYTTKNDTAVGNTDFTPVSGTLTFNSNETSKSFTIAVTNNPQPQGSKQFQVVLSNITGGATLNSPDTEVVTITDLQSSSSSSSTTNATSSSSSSANPAGTLSFSALSYMVDEKAGTVAITVVRGGGSTGTVSVAYGTNNGSAINGSEFTSVSGTLTFNQGETTKSFTVPINSNSNITGNKSFNVIIGTPTGGATIDTATALVTIFDDESGTFGSGAFKFANKTYEISKSAGKVVVTVQRTGGASGTVSVGYSTSGLTAASGTDFTYTSGTLSFVPGEASKTITIPIPSSTTAGGKTFSVDLSSPASPASLVSPYSTAVTIDN